MKKPSRKELVIPLLLTTTLFLLGGTVLSARAEGGGENWCRDVCCGTGEEPSPCANGQIPPPLPEPECGMRRCGCIGIPVFSGWPPIIGYDCWCLCEYENVECDDVWWDCVIQQR